MTVIPDRKRIAHSCASIQTVYSLIKIQGCGSGLQKMREILLMMLYNTVQHFFMFVASPWSVVITIISTDELHQINATVVMISAQK